MLTKGALVIAALLFAGCATYDRPLPRVVFSSGKGIALQSSPGGAVHYYEFKRRK